MEQEEDPDCSFISDGISLADYLSLVLAVGKIDNALSTVDGGQMT